MDLYYAEHAYASANNGSFTSDLTALYQYAPPHTLDGTCTRVPEVKVYNGSAHFEGMVPALDGEMVAFIRDDRLLEVEGW